MVFVVRHLHPDGGAAHVALIIGALGAVGVGEPHGRRVGRAGTEVADPIARRHRVQYVQPRVQHAEHDFGVEGTKDLARVALLLVLELDIENVAGELRKSEPFRLRGSIDVDFAPVLTGSHRPFLPPSSTYSCTHELVVEEWNAIVSSEASPPVRRCASARSGLRPNTR